MLVTKEEAKELWCPEATGGLQVEDRYSDNSIIQRGTASGSRRADGSPLFFCLGPGCMWWRWGEFETDPTATEFRKRGTRGYCGAAGAAR